MYVFSSISSERSGRVRRAPVELALYRFLSVAVVLWEGDLFSRVTVLEFLGKRGEVVRFCFSGVWDAGCGSEASGYVIVSSCVCVCICGGVCSFVVSVTVYRVFTILCALAVLEFSCGDDLSGAEFRVWGEGLRAPGE